MNSVFTFVLCIVTIVLVAQLAETYLKQRKKKPEEDAELEETLAKIDVLEERIEVLERIVTEKRYDLKKEIDAL